MKKTGASKQPSLAWKGLEDLVAEFHRWLPGELFDVEQNRRLADCAGSTAQIDVLLKPRTPYQAPILISCKCLSSPVGVEHAREWASVVQQFGAAKGVIVSISGFTRRAKRFAETPTNRVELWQVRELVDKDFNGRIRRLRIVGTFAVPCVPEGSVTFRVRRMGPDQGPAAPVPFRFSYEDRDRLFLQDEHGNIRENIWDEFAEQYERQVSLEKGIIPIRIAYGEPRYLTINNVRYQFVEFSAEVHQRQHEVTSEVDARDRFSHVYENALTGDQRPIPTDLVQARPL
ncbi:MAG: restriction endonuclease [Candidatus Bipolaricaulota bacterium]